MNTVTSTPIIYPYPYGMTTSATKICCNGTCDITTETPNLTISVNDTIKVKDCCDTVWFDLDALYKYKGKKYEKREKSEEPEETKEPEEPVIDNDFVTPDRIIYNPPCTIVFWKNGDKTVVRCSEGETFNKYYGYCAALAKHISGNNNRLTKLVNSGIDSTKTAKKLEKKSEVKKPAEKKPISKKAKKGSK